ncbi:MAG: hypothetical protein EA359_03050 [Balneolaceae bacterium]|nr:MAG: hypothetical protein EA359_03050 [Balneolaceae bacterium]
MEVIRKSTLILSVIILIHFTQNENVSAQHYLSDFTNNISGESFLFEPSETDHSSEGWSFVVKPYIVLPLSLEADIMAIGVTESLSFGLEDVLNLDQAFTGSIRVETRRNGYGIYSDISYLLVKDSRRVQNYPLPAPLAAIINSQFNPPVTIPPGTPATAEIIASGSAFTADLGGFYRIKEGFLTNNAVSKYYIEPMLGLRLSIIQSEIDFDLDLANIPVVRTSAEETNQPFKVVAGVRAGIETENSWAFELDSNIGAGLFSSDQHLSIRVTPEVSYSVSEMFSFIAGYQFRYLDFDKGEYGLKQVQHGLSIGGVIRF